SAQTQKTTSLPLKVGLMLPEIKSRTIRLASVALRLLRIIFRPDIACRRSKYTWLDWEPTSRLVQTTRLLAEPRTAALIYSCYLLKQVQAYLQPEAGDQILTRTKAKPGDDLQTTAAPQPILLSA